MKAVWLLGAVVGFAGVGEGSHGAIVYLTQQRSVAANGFVNASPEGLGPLNAVGFGDFNGTRMTTFSSGAGSALASQVSRLLPDAILMDATSEVTVAGGAAMDAMSSARLQVTFRLDAPSSYRIDHSHSTGGVRGALLAQATLTGSTGTIFDWTDDLDGPNTWPVSPVLGSVDSGQYTLQIELFASRSSPPMSLGTTGVTSSFSLVIPTPLPCASFWCVAAFGSRRSRRSVAPAQ